MEHEELSNRCLDLAKHLATLGQCFRLSLKLTPSSSSTLSFNFLAESGNPMLPRKIVNKRQEKKKKSPSNRKRDKERMERYQRRKENTNNSETSPSPSLHSVTLSMIPQGDRNSTLVDEKDSSPSTNAQFKIWSSR